MQQSAIWVHSLTARLVDATLPVVPISYLCVIQKNDPIIIHEAF